MRTWALVACIVVQSASRLAAGANAPWGDNSQIQVGVAIQRGATQSAWSDGSRSDVTNGIAWAQPVGDGTYQVRADVVPGGVYNFIWFAKTVSSPSLAGFTSGYQQAEPIPASGSDTGFFFAASTTNPGGNLLSGGTTEYRSIGGDARRVVTIPDVAPGTTVYVYANFGSTPTGVANLEAVAFETSVRLTWQGGGGYWGAAVPALDTLGGSYRLFRATTQAGPYTTVTTLAGTATIYTDTALTTGTSYYYVFSSSDSYDGATNPSAFTPFPNLYRGNAPGQTIFTPEAPDHDKLARTGATTPVMFKVDGADWDYIRRHDYLVYMTPWEEEAWRYPGKIPGRIVKVYVP